MDEENDINMKRAKIILSYFYFIFNIIIIFLCLYLVQSKNEFMKILKYKLFTLIILDSISFSLFENFTKNLISIFNEKVIDIIFVCLSSIEFYIFLSFIYQIYDNAKISKLAKKKILINPVYLSFLFIFVIFSFHKYTKIYKTLNSIENIIILCCITLLYRYLRNITKTIKNNLLPRDIKSAYIFYSLRMLISICFLLMVCYYALKLIIILTPQIYKIYVNIALYTVNFVFKFYIFVFFAVIIYQFNKNYFINKSKINPEETDKIIISQMIG